MCNPTEGTADRLTLVWSNNILKVNDFLEEIRPHVWRSPYADQLLVP